MSSDLRTNTTFDALARFLKDHDNYAICGHVSPDGDCLGSQLALAHGLRCLGKTVVGLLSQPQPVESSLRFLPGIDELVAAENVSEPPRVFIAVDTPNEERLGPAASLFHSADMRVIIDHHGADESLADLFYIDPDAPSASTLIWSLLHAFDFDRFSAQDQALMAECTYAGLVTDTGRFAYQNATEQAFLDAAAMVQAGVDPQKVAREVYQNRTIASIKLEVKAIEHMELLCNDQVVISWIDEADMIECGATRSDAEPLIDVLRSLSGVKVACLLRDRGEQIRGSLRAKDETDVAAIAQSFGGGGHKAAAGFTVNGPMADALCSIKEAISAALS